MVKTLPFNKEAEEGVLGAILIDKDAISSVSAIITPNDFYNDVNSDIFSIMLELYEEREPIDIITLGAKIKKNKNLKSLKSSYLTDLLENVATSINVETYARLIKEASVKRSLIKMSNEVSSFCFEEIKDLDEILETAEKEIFSITLGKTTKGFTPIKDSLADSFDRIDMLHKSGGGLRGVPTGFTDLDNVLSGMQASNLLILAARPGQGKTAMAVNIAQKIAVDQQVPVGIFSLEMSQEELVDRLLVGQADIDAWRLKTGRLTESDFTKISDAMGELAEAPIFIDDTPGISIYEMRTKARRLQMEQKVGLLIVDYLQLIDPGRKVENRVQEVSVVSKFLKNLARELKIPILALSQLNRSVEHREKGKPQLADLRESGTIEQDADVVMFLYRNDGEENIGSSIRQMKLIVAKHRNGALSEIDLLFRGDRVKFESIEKKREEGK